MLCLGSNSACDICYESFDNSLRIPSAIDCGHVFCTSCLSQIRIITCPLCRAPFNPMRAIKLFGIDLNNSSGGPSYTEARRIRKAIGDVMRGGIREAQVQQLLAECKSFIQSHHGEKDSEDLRNSCRMFAHLCDVQTKSNENEQLINSLRLDLAKLHVSENDVKRNLKDAHANIFDLMQKSNSQKGEIEKLQKALTRWANNQGSPPRRADSTQRHLPHLQSQASRSSLRGLTPPDDQNLTISPLPDFTTNILLQALPGVDEGDEAEGEGSGSGEDSLEARTPGSREAAGYLRSSYEVLGGPSASPPQLAPSYSSEGTLPLLDDTPLHLPMQPPGLLSMTAPKDEPSVSHSSLFAHPSQSPSQRLQALLTDDRPVRPSSLPVHTEGFPVHSPQEGLKEKKGKKKREKKRDRAEKRPEVDIGLVPEMPFSFPLWKDVSTQEGAAPKSPTHCNPTPPTRRQSVPVNSTLFSHAPPEACQSFTGNASGGVKSPRRHSESKDQWRGYQHPNPYVVDENSVSRPSDTQHPGHYHYNDESGSWVTSGFGFF